MDEMLDELMKAQDAAYEKLRDCRKNFDECVMYGSFFGSRVLIMTKLAELHEAEAELLRASAKVAERSHDIAAPNAGKGVPHA